MIGFHAQWPASAPAGLADVPLTYDPPVTEASPLQFVREDPNFDPIKVADEIAALETEAQAAKGVFDDRSARIAAILWDIKQHHPEHLKAVCERAGIGRNRRKQLLQIGSGSKTLEKSRAENKTRVQRHRAKARAITVMATPAEAGAKSQPETGNNDPAKSGTETASAHAANESEAAPATKPKPAPSESAQALAEFKVACDHWLPQLDGCDQAKASTYVNSKFEEMRNSRGSPAA